VQSNDELYGGAPQYMTELSEQINALIVEILQQLAALGERSEGSATAKLNQAKSALDLVNQIAARMDITPGVAAFIVKLMDLANKQKSLFTRAEQRYMSNTIDYVIARSATAVEFGSQTLALRDDVGLSAQAMQEFTKKLKIYA
jgi:hypothetical protein